MKFRLADAAAGLKERAGDPACVVGGNEGDDVSDVVRPAGAAERGLCNGALLKIRARDARRFGSFGDGKAWVNRIDANLLGPEFLGEDTGDGVDRALGTGVDRRVRRREFTDDRTNVDNAPAF